MVISFSQPEQKPFLRKIRPEVSEVSLDALVEMIRDLNPDIEVMVRQPVIGDTYVAEKNPEGCLKVLSQLPRTSSVIFRKDRKRVTTVVSYGSDELRDWVYLSYRITD
mgnify:CR=1 FL=1